MKRRLLFLLITIVSITVVNAQTVLFAEDFESYALETGIVGQDLQFLPIGGYPGGVPFTIDATDVDFSDSSSDYIRIDVSSGELQFQDLEGEGIVTFNAVDISSQTGNVTINIDKVDFNIGGASIWEDDDYIDISYSLDNGATFIKILDHMGNGSPTHTFVPEAPIVADTDYDYQLSEIIDPGAATTLILRLSGFNDSGDEEFEFDDINIIRGGISLFSEDFEGYDGINGPEFIGEDIGVNGSGIFEAISSGDYPTVPWTITLSDDETLENSGDHVWVEEQSGSNVLEFNDLGDNQPVTFETDIINITGESNVTFGFDINFRETTYEPEDFVDVLYSIDGGATFTLAQDDGNGHTYSGTTIAGFGVNEDQMFVETLTGLTSTNFILRIVASNDSTSEDYQVDNVLVVSGTTLSINEEDNLSRISVYPNPAKDGILNIKTTYKGNTYVTLYDLSGRQVYKDNLPANNIIDISNFQSGLKIIK